MADQPRGKVSFLYIGAWQLHKCTATRSTPQLPTTSRSVYRTSADRRAPTCAVQG